MKQIWWLALLAACDPQVDGGYSGVPLARVSGTIRNTRTLPVGDAEVVAVWIGGDSPRGDLAEVNAVEVEGSFPAKFTLTFYKPIEPPFLIGIPGAPLGVGLIFAAERGTDYATADAEGLLGVATDHVLVYLPDDVPPGSYTSYVLRGTPRAGFHLYGIHKLSEADIEAREACESALAEDGVEPTLDEIFGICGGTGFDDFVPLDNALDTPLQIDLVDDPSTLEVPNVN